MAAEHFHQTEGKLAGSPTAAVELEHLCGFTNRFLNTVAFHSQETNSFIYPVGCVVIIEDITNPHHQDFLRAHDAEISAIAISKNGKLLASGQRGSERRKGSIAPVIVWDFENRTIYKDFGGLADSVICLEFSPDSRFLVATGANNMIYVWDVTTGEIIYSRKTELTCFLACWGAVTPPGNGNRYPSYTLCTAFESEILMHDILFDIRSMCYVLETAKVQLPSAGLHRKHVVGLISGEFLMTGTMAGDLCVFNLSTRVFRCAIPVLNGGVCGMVQFNQDTFIMCGGDGKVKKIRGHDAHWDVLKENILEAPCTGITLSADKRECLVGTKNGKLWRCLSTDMTATLLSASHTVNGLDSGRMVQAGERAGWFFKEDNQRATWTSGNYDRESRKMLNAPTVMAAFGKRDSEKMVTVSNGGEMFLWDLSDYSHLQSSRLKIPIACVCISEEEDEILVGCEDGFLRAYRLSRRAQSTSPVWEIPNAHRGCLTVVKEWSQYIVTGGVDCYCRVWHRTTKELLTQFCVHRRPVTSIILDNEHPHIFHSGSEDKFVVTYDVKLNKSIVQHATPNSNITGLCQRKDCEKEVISCGLDGRILFWDVDVAEPVGCFHEPGCKFLCCDLSPNGRYVAAGSDEGFFYIFDLAVSAKIAMHEGHSGAVASVAWAPDMKQCISVGKDCSVAVWNFFDRITDNDFSGY